jgi:hypothetical protein
MLDERRIDAHGHSKTASGGGMQVGESDEGRCRASVIVARKSLRVNSGFSEPPSEKKRGRRNAERRTLVV